MFLDSFSLAVVEGSGKQPLPSLFFFFIDMSLENFLVIFMTLSLNKTPEMVAWREPPGVFCDVGCCWCFTSIEIFHF